MAESFGTKLKHAWNAFRDKKQEIQSFEYGRPVATGGRPQHRSRFGIANRGSIIIPIYNRIGIDVAQVDIRHIRLNEHRRFMDEIQSSMNYCFSLSPNIDQTSRSFFQDAVMTLCERGAIAIVPVKTSINPDESGGYDILELRVSEIVEWYPQHVKVNVYNDAIDKGVYEDLILPKKMVAIVENPLYAVMNEQNSALQRLLRKLDQLDAIDEQSSSGKLDIIIQLPYQIKSELRQEQAEKRRQMIEAQLADSKYGIAYMDATERITQLNRPAENNLMNQVEYLTNLLYGQLGLTEEIFKGTADEAAMLNYFSRTVEPFLAAITQAMKKSFLTKTAITQGQDIRYFRDPFKLVPTSQVAEIADKFTRNEILSSNEIRGIIGFQPSDDPKADELRNSNLSAPKEDTTEKIEVQEPEELESKNNSLKELEKKESK